ncbi:hypothetical protein IMZ48_28700 [Candidatus Bathyarchaeota archaeon]|nr:hypothetical protein [Candidatus Bathyarchaeota archaeon]
MHCNHSSSGYKLSIFFEWTLTDVSSIRTALGALDMVCTNDYKRSVPTRHNKATGMFTCFVIAMSEFSRVSLHSTDSGTFIVTDTTSTT